jgi:uncharacterized membrane protein YcjF (UPF0283 family)
MSNLWLKIKVWTKVIVFGLIILYVLAFVVKNQGTPAQMWVSWNYTIESTVLRVGFFAFLAGVIVTILTRTTLLTMRQIREIKQRNRSVKLERAVQDMQNKAAMLRARPEMAQPAHDDPSDEPAV